MKKGILKSKARKLSKKAACILATALMCVNSLCSGGVPVLAQLSVGGAEKIAQGTVGGDNWINTDKSGDDQTHYYSSYESSKEKALKVDASYGFELVKTEKTKVSVEKGNQCSAPSTYQGTDLKLPDFLKKYTWFKTDKNNAGNIQIKVSNLTIYQCDNDGSNGRWEKVDLVRTVTSYEKYKGDDGVEEGYVALGAGITNACYVGIEEMKVSSDFYKAGTSTKITLKSNVTLTDIDTNQYIGINAKQINGQYVSANTKLSYKKDGSTNVYYADYKTNYDSEAFTAAGFIFEDSGFDYTFGRIRDESPTNQEQYVGTGQNMVNFKPVPPNKTVSNTEEKVDDTKNTVRDLGQSWYYFVEQPIASNIPENFYYDKFIMRDTIEECMKILDVKVEAQNKDAETIDATAMFNINQSNNVVTATLKNPKNSEFYKNAVYTMKIKTKMDVPDNATAAQLEALRTKWTQHGHYNSEKKILTEKNKASTVIDEYTQPTNEVSTDIHLSTDDKNEPGLAVTKVVDKYEHKVGDKVKYTVTAKNTNSKADTAYFTIQDLTLPAGMSLDFKSLQVSGIEAANYTLEQQGNGWVLKSKGDYALPYGTTITVTYEATAAGEVNGNEIINRVKAFAAGIPEKEANAKVWINSPDLKITKKADKEKYKVGDTVTYTVDVSQEAIGCVARNIVLKDVLKTEGVKLQKNSVVVMDAEGNVLKDVNVTVKNNDFDIVTHKNLVCPTDQYSVYDGKLVKQDKFNPLNLTKETAFKIEYQAVITDEQLSGQEITNVATVNSDENIPKEDEETVPIQGPNLDITKTSDAGVYKVGDTGKYTLTAKQTREGETAKNVVIKDKFGIEGVEIDKDSFVVKLNGETITPTKIEATADGFTVETGKDLTDADKLEVTYQVLFKEASLENKQVPNKVAVSADNAQDKETDHEVTIKTADDPVLKILKESDKKEYFLGEIGKYTLTVTQERLDAVAKNVVIEDAFDQKGMVIDPASLKVTVSGKDITAQCKLAVEDNKYTISTNADLSREVMKISYDVLFKEETLRDKNVINTAKAKADNAEEVQTQNTIKINKKDTRFAVQKDAKDKDYQVGDLIPYSIKVNLTKPGDTAKNITIKDTLPKGLELEKDTIKVSGVEKYETKVTGNVLTIQINQMVYGQKAIITYKAKILEGTEGKSLTNKVEVTSDDTIPANAKKTIKIPKPGVGSKIAKTFDQAKPGLLAAIIAAGVAGVIWLYRKKKLKK